MRTVSSETLKALTECPDQIRNICILAHVDHGKTTFADCLVAGNGIISTRLSGKLRYMDSRQDEQERGITMKSSSVALYHKKDEKEHLIHLLDSPGHVDFCYEVDVALATADGALILVDCVEGVCPQTVQSLRGAYRQRLTPILVLNKIDRLITEQKLDPLDAYFRMVQIVEQVNVVMGELFASELLRGEEEEEEGKQTDMGQRRDYTSALEKADDSDVYFQPSRGNVLFGSALHGWTFSISNFVTAYSKILGVDEHIIREGLWGDCYYNKKQKKILTGAHEKGKKPLFVQCILDNLWHIYDPDTYRDPVAFEKVLKTLGITLNVRDMREKDTKLKAQAVLSQWLPAAKATLDAVVHLISSPVCLDARRAEAILGGEEFQLLPRDSQALKGDVIRAGTTPESPVICVVAKMIAVDVSSLPENRPRVLSPEELAERRGRIKEIQERRELERQKRLTDFEAKENGIQGEIETSTPMTEVREEEDKNKVAFIAFTRILSGTLKPGLTCYALGPKHDPKSALEAVNRGEEIDPSWTISTLPAEHHATRCTLGKLYLMVGREMEPLEEAAAGNIVGIGGLEGHILKFGALSSTLACPPLGVFSSHSMRGAPILKVAVEPKIPKDLPMLIRGLQLLNQADPCVQVTVEESGEHCLMTAGEVHLQRCVTDLEEQFSQVEVTVSAPIVPLRETIVPPPVLDKTKETISVVEKPDKNKPSHIITLSTPNRRSSVTVTAIPLPEAVTSLLDSSVRIIRLIQEGKASRDEKDGFRKKLEEAFHSNDREEISEEWEQYSDLVDHLWKFGPRRIGPNLLFNYIRDYRCNFWSDEIIGEPGKRKEVVHTFLTGFQLATSSGPLCKEPMMGVGFVVSDWTVDSEPLVNPDIESLSHSSSSAPFSGQVLAMFRDACLKAFQVRPQRLRIPMYECKMQVSADGLGRLVGVVSRRNGRVIEGDTELGASSVFNVTAVLPVLESLDFAQEIRGKTSGTVAQPQLTFSHWEVLDEDPFWQPCTEEEVMLWGEKSDTGNRAMEYINTVRKRKGLPVREKVVERAEKQRTLSKTK